MQTNANKTAVAHELARIVYHLLTTRQRYDEIILAKHEQISRARAGRRCAARSARRLEANLDRESDLLAVEETAML